MLNLTGEEWAILNTVSAFQKLLRDVEKEIVRNTEALADGAILVTDPAELAIKYATMVGIIQTCKDIVEYRPYNEEDEERSAGYGGE